MLSDLFNDPNNENSSGKSYTFGSQKDLNKNLSRRKATNLCGIINQGATCYLNTLIQTLFLTKEFRENLFSLRADELGLSAQANGKGKVRVILIELQRLFSQLLMLDQEACSTSRLTDSFGWSNNEELQQHDVQELNRILFAAIEQSLVNTKQAKLIQNLYRGTYVNKIRCLTCLTVFEREEEYLDIPITVQGSTDLHTSLASSFISRESLNGNNQYKCEKCNNEYRDAEKYCQLKNLPPILTFSLLRFTYDLKTYQRIKEVGKFEFPLDLDLKAYMEDSFKLQIKDDYTNYELFSVIIHSGSAYGGHYHTYIKDFDNLGEWTLKSDENLVKHKAEFSPTRNNEQDDDIQTKEICLICSNEEDIAQKKTRNANNKELICLDYLKYEEPLDLLKAFIYNKYEYQNVKIESICSDLNKLSGMSWNKTFKNKYGTLEKFLRKHDDSFEISADKLCVKLKQHDRIKTILSSEYKNHNRQTELIESCLKETEVNTNSNNASKKTTNSKKKLSEEDELEQNAKFHWYDFDDSKITPIYQSQIKKQFEGKESAYMLFYRRVMDSSSSSSSNQSFETNFDIKEKLYSQVPEWIKNEIVAENQRLNEIRLNAEKKQNTIFIECFLENDFYTEKNVLNLNQNCENKSFSLEIDKRFTTVKDLKQLLVAMCTSINDSVYSKYDEQHVKEMQSRETLCLKILLDENNQEKRPSFYWLLGQRVDTSISGSSGRCNYFIKSLLKEPDEKVFQSISYCNNANKSILILTKNIAKWHIGDEFEPLRIIAKFYDRSFKIQEVSYTFAKCTTVKEVKKEISELLLNELNIDHIEDSSKADPVTYESFVFNLLTSKSKKNNDKILLEASLFDQKSLCEMSIKNEDIITIESSIQDENFFKNGGDSKAFSSSNKLVCELGELKVNAINLVIKPNELNKADITPKEIKIEGAEKVNNVIIMIMSAFQLNDSNIDLFHLRYVNEESFSENDLTMHLANCVSANFNNLNQNLTLDNNYLSMSFFGYPGITIQSDLTIDEFLIKNNLKNSTGEKITFLLCPERAPLNQLNEIVLKCLLDQKLEKPSSQSENNVEIIINFNDCKVGELTQKIVEKMNLPSLNNCNDEEKYYLQTIGWMGDPEKILNDFDQDCSLVPLKHNQQLMITKGKLIPSDHIKVRIWISTEKQVLTEDSVQSLTEKLNEQKIADEDVILNDLIEDKYNRFKLIEELIVPNRITLEDFKGQIQALILDKNIYENCEHLRLRLLKRSNFDSLKPRFQMKKCLYEWNKTLKQLHLFQETELCVQTLDEEDCFNQGIIILDCVRINLQTKLCEKSSFKQILWNINNGATLASLKDSILKAYSEQIESNAIFRMQIAKKFLDKHQWILLKELNAKEAKNSINTETLNCNNNSTTNNTQKKKKRGNQANQQTSQKSNLKQSPFFIDDGDLIAFTIVEQSSGNEKQITANDFMSTVDLEFQQKITEKSAEVSRLRKERKNTPEFGVNDKKTKNNRRLEVGIKIRIDDFNECDNLD